MAKGSQLTQLKSALSQAGVTRQQQPSKKRKRTTNPQQSDKDKKAAKLQEIHERLNPFDIKVTKLKHDVAGRKIRGTTGRPAKSKQTGLEQREKGLLKEYEDKNRAGGVIDRRFGENDPTMTPEERMLERFTTERQRASRGSAFNLDDDDELTHYGQSLSKLDDFDNTGLAVDGDEEESLGYIDERTVKSVHFGGFDDEDGDDGGDEEPERKKSKAEVMAEVIAKSKEHKILRQMSRQQDDDLRHELDNELDSIRGLLFAEDTSTLIPLEAATLRNKPSELPVSDPSSGAGDATIARPPKTIRDQAFDQYVRELAFDKRAKPKDRTKTEEELALEEKERLEKAERRRVRRMEGLDDYDSEEEEGIQKLKRAQTRGGDDLEDDFMDDGELVGLGNGLTEEGASDNEEGVDMEGSEGGTDEDEGEGSSEDDSEGDEEGSEGEDMEDESLDVEEGEHEDLVTSRRKPSKKPPPDKELPYTFGCPESHDDFLEMTEGIKDSNIPTVIQRIRVLHHPSLAENNKFKLQALTNVLIDHILYVTSPPTPRFGVMSGLLPHLAALTRAYPTTSATHFIFKLKLMEKNLKRGLSQGALNLESKTFPGLPELAILRTVGTLWSTSDMNHAVVSPARLLMAAYLGLGRVRSVQDLASGLFLCTIWLQYESLSSRFVPEAVNFALNAVLHLAPHKYVQPIEVPGSFPHPDVGSDLAKLLRINPKKVSLASLSSPVDIVAILADTENDETTKAQLLSTALDILGRFAEMYKSLDGFPELFTPILEVIKGLGTRKLPEPLQKRITSVKEKLECLLKFHLQSRQPLTLQAHKPIPIPSYVPKFESTKSSYFKSQDPDHEKNEAAKLRRQYKEEKKGALRELRKDARFLASVQQAQQRAKDEAYASRMKRVFGSLEGERAEEKQMEKAKAKAKKRAGK